MTRIREHLTYANVMTTILAFVVLAGGTAFAAGQLAKNSVGKKQLKANAVTTAKIKKNAVTRAKIKAGAIDAGRLADGSVNGAKVADASLTESDINAAATPFGRIVHEARGNSTVALTKSAITPYPLGSPTFSQPAGMTNIFAGAADVTFDPACAPPRSVTAIAFLDPPDPSKLTSYSNIVAAGAGGDENGSRPTLRVNIGPYLGSSFQSDVVTNHTLVFGLQLNCGAGDGAKATFAAVDVIGTK